MARTSMMKAAEPPTAEATTAAAEAAEDNSDQAYLSFKPVEREWSWISEDKLNETTPCVAEDGRILLPGFGRPLNAMLEQKKSAPYFSGEKDLFNRCPIALQGWSPEPLTVRERNMMQVVNAITDKPDWRRKVFDGTIIAKWRVEAVTEEGQGFTEKMFDYVSPVIEHLDCMNR